MKRHCWVAVTAAGFLTPWVWTAGALAADAAIADAGPQGQYLPPALAAENNLGQAGLLRSYFDSDQFGSVQWRVGQGRNTVSDAAASGRPKSDYKDGTTDTIVPTNFLFMLPDQESMIRLGLRGTFSNGANYPVELDGGTGRLDLQYLRFLNPQTMVAIGGLYEQTYLDIEGAGSVKRFAGGVRGDVLSEFSTHWGIAARAEYSWGQTDLSIAAGPGVTMRHNQGDDHLYTQAELIGQYRHDDIALVPEGWVFHPVLGIQFERSFLEATANNFGVVSSGVVGPREDYGTAWAHLRLEKETAPGHWSPNVLVGFEREYVNDLDSVVYEPNYAVFGAGASIMFGKGQRFEISYTRHEGLRGERWNQALVGTLTMNF
ncbi:hypothetical protein [Rhizobium paknamense]|uniref:Autotransporter outer membrane beta-barrel domain-containing protein n=1 Tax=Rhizobium paknamense TaxID=1206817 RepID=A0ABU0IBR2_9HYPH|nr:hypothetical protein [Rhizobium paknamense]MDQ0455667.1 hypothetical protein [Rhizobium paknamense]